jgi:TonB family protein
MRGWQCVAVTGLLAAQTGICAAQTPPANAAVRVGRPSFGYNPTTRCPDLTTASADQAAVVVFRVGDTGSPSQASIKSSSGSEQLDAAATACVLRLHFYPALRAGDGVAVESWQQMTFGWKAPPPEQKAGAHCDPNAKPDAATGRAPASANAALPRQGKVGMCVCVDEAGKLAHPPTVLQSAGDAGFDKAAVEIASGGHYQPSTQNGKAVSDCFPVTVKFEVQ